MKIIDSKADLKKLAIELRVRDDWHEPDEQGISAAISGHRFDNAGTLDELVIYLIRDGKILAAVNLATLFAFACDTHTGVPRHSL